MKTNETEMTGKYYCWRRCEVCTVQRVHTSTSPLFLHPLDKCVVTVNNCRTGTTRQTYLRTGSARKWKV